MKKRVEIHVGAIVLSLTEKDVRALVRVALGSPNTTVEDRAIVYRLGEALNEMALIGND